MRIAGISSVSPLKLDDGQVVTYTADGSLAVGDMVLVEQVGRSLVVMCRLTGAPRPELPCRASGVATLSWSASTLSDVLWVGLPAGACKGPVGVLTTPYDASDVGAVVVARNATPSGFHLRGVIADAATVTLGVRWFAFDV